MNLNFRDFKVLVDKEESDKNYEEILIKPLEKGFGLTIGNAMRRVMLNSMPGAAIIAFKIDGVNHEFMQIPGSSNDTLELISALKSLKFKVDFDEIKEDKILSLKVDKAGVYTADGFKLPKGIELLNPDTNVINGDGKKEFDVEILLRVSRGSVQSREHKNVPEGFVQLDGLFSPIEKVGYEVNPVIDEEEVSHEELKLFVTTDGTITAEESVQMASSIIESHFSKFKEMEKLKTELEIFKEKERERISIDNTTIEELNLSVRSTNALKNAGVSNVGQLRKIGETELKDFKNMGKKSVDEVKEVLRKMNVQLGDY